MIDIIKRILGENWKTALFGIGLFIFAAGKCLIGGGVFGECITEAWNAAFTTGGAGLFAGSQASRFR